jgi:hypothetical protein
VYHYAGNNPVKYVDLDGEINIDHQEKMDGFAKLGQTVLLVFKADFLSPWSTFLKHH